MNYLKLIFMVIMLMTAGLLSSCGSSDGSSSTPGASLVLTVDNVEVDSGGVIIASVKLTSTTQPAINNVKITVLSTDNNAIADTSGITDGEGKVNILLRAKDVPVDKTVTLIAAAEGIVQSSTVRVVVKAAALLTVNLPTDIPADVTEGTPGSIVRVVLSGTTLKFVGTGGSPVANQVVTISIDSIVNKSTDDRVVFSPVQGSEITAPPGVITVSTDTLGLANIPMAIDATVPGKGSLHVFTINWRAVTTYNGQNYTVTGQSMVTVTNS